MVRSTGARRRRVGAVAAFILGTALVPLLRALGEGENVITLQPAAVLEGRVVSAREPTCVTATGETSITLTSTAEAGGAFRIPGLDRGIWRVDGRLP